MAAPGLFFDHQDLGSLLIAASLNDVPTGQPCSVYQVSGTNNGAGDFWIQLHNSAAIPVNGAIPLRSYLVRSMTNFSISLTGPSAEPGVQFAAGAWWCVSSTPGPLTFAPGTSINIHAIGVYA